MYLLDKQQHPFGADILYRHVHVLLNTNCKLISCFPIGQLSLH